MLPQATPLSVSFSPLFSPFPDPVSPSSVPSRASTAQLPQEATTASELYVALVRIPPSLHLAGDSGHNCYPPPVVTGLPVALRCLRSRLLCCWSIFRHICSYQDLVSPNVYNALLGTHVAISDNNRVTRPYHVPLRDVQ